MNNSEFYDTIRFISEHKNTIALININEFKRLKRVNGEYKWIHFEIGDLKAIPVETKDFKEKFRSTKEIVNIDLTPVWTFLTNNKQIITPNIETFELTEYSNFHPRYRISRKINKNHHYLSDSTWKNIFDKMHAQEENAIEWEKNSYSSLLAPVDEEILKLFLNKYQDELEEFNTLYEESVKTTKELRAYQKKLK